MFEGVSIENMLNSIFYSLNQQQTWELRYSRIGQLGLARCN